MLKNDPTRPGTLACKKWFFGPDNQFAIAMMNTSLVKGYKSNARWLVWNMKAPDELTGMPFSVVAKGSTFGEALDNLSTTHPADFR